MNEATLGLFLRGHPELKLVHLWISKDLRNYARGFQSVLNALIRRNAISESPGEASAHAPLLRQSIQSVSEGSRFLENDEMKTTSKANQAPASRFAKIEGKRIHYLTAGQGPVLILLHGYTQTSRMWRPLIDRLKDKFTIVAPDLPGIGDSDIPKSGCDMKTAAIRIHALAKSIGVAKACVVGHDIGLMVAYAYAAQFSAEVEKLAVMDAFLPGVVGWELAYNNDNLWHFRFHGPTPEALVKGHEKIYFAYFWNDLAADKKRSLSTRDRNAYVAAYSRPGRMRAGWAYFAAWPETAKDFAEMAKTKLTMPVLSIAGEKASAAILGTQMKLVATAVTEINLKDTGHWLMEELPEETMKALIAFL